MLVYDTKVGTYLQTNSVVSTFIYEVNSKIEEYYREKLSNLPMPLIQIDLGNKFIRITCNNSCWGFISRVDGTLKGAPVKKGDLLKPATWKAPAKHARGNIIEGTARWGIYGPEYLK